MPPVDVAIGHLDSRSFVDNDLNEGAENVFRRTRVLDGSTWESSGDRWATLDHASRAAAPWLFSDGPLISEHISIVSSQSGSVEIYELEKSGHLRTPPSFQKAIRTDSSITQRATADPAGSQELAMRLRSFDSWDVPALPDVAIVSPGDFKTSKADRSRRIEERFLKFERESEWLVQLLASLGAKVTYKSFETGWLAAKVPNSVIAGLVADPRLGNVVSSAPLSENFCDTSCTQPGANTWRLGSGSSSQRFDGDRFVSNYYTGEIANSSFHGWGDITVAVMEPAPQSNWEDEARWLRDWDGSAPSRVRQKWNCSGSTCSQVTNFVDSEPPANNHPNWMTAIVAADLQDGQGIDYAMADQCWIPWAGGHCADWRGYTSGVAPEAGLQQWAGVNATTTMAFAINNAAVDVGGTFDRPDIMQLATSDKGAVCDMASSAPYEEAIEVAYSSGILIVNGPGNAGVGSPPTSSGGCNLDSPGDLPTAFTVNGLATSASGCRSSYRSCALSPPDAARGGIDLKIGTGTISRAMSGVDISAPGEVSFVPDGNGSYGETRNGAPISGTSPASAHVSGAAALVKHWLLDEGSTWINSPGRLHTMMLGMGDRWAGASQRTAGFDRIHGVGKLKLRPLFTGGTTSVWGRSMRTHSSSSTGTYRYVPWSSPLPSGTEIVKCVMQEHEYMASKDDVSDQYLKVVVRNSYLGSCDPNNGYVFTSRSDASYDLKHQAAVTNSDISLENKCISVELTRSQISTSGLASASVYCYYSGENDDEPN